MCGTAKPRKEIGPQKAVVIAVSNPVVISNMLRVRRMLTPKFSAYLTPNSMALSGLIRSIESSSPANVKSEK